MKKLNSEAIGFRLGLRPCRDGVGEEVEAYSEATLQTIL
jgi:hypothetical protein